MTVPTYAFQTYQGIGIREDLSNTITNIAPLDTIFYSAIGSVPVKQIKHEWQTDTLRAAAANKVAEGANAAPAAVVPTVRLFNYVQHQEVSFIVTDAMEAVDKAGRDSEIEYQKGIYGKALMKDVEYAFVQEVSAAGSTSVAPSMKGCANFIVTNIDYASDATLNVDGTVTGGTARPLTADIVKTQHQAAYNAGGEPTMLLCSPFQSRQFVNFASATGWHRQMIEGGKMEDYVDVFRDEFGTLTVKPHRNFPTDIILGMDLKTWKKATLIPVGSEELARNGRARTFLMSVSHTLECRAEAANFRITNLTTS